MRYIADMKTATIPPIRVEPQFREEMEQALEVGESMTSLVEKAVRSEVERRRTHAEFVKRGLAAIARSEAEGNWIAADVVIAKLEARLAEVRKHRAA